MTKSKTEYKHFKSNYNSTNNINGMNKNEKKIALLKNNAININDFRLSVVRSNIHIKAPIILPI